VKKVVSILLFFMPFVAIAQVIITGKVINAADNNPLPNVSVFLSNATVGTTTNAGGNFTLSNVKPGRYDLVVSIIGYETHHQDIAVANADLNLPDITIVVKNNVMSEVKIGPPDPNYDIDFQVFKEEFLGRTENAKRCTIVNPEVIALNYNAKKKLLSASSDGFIIIKNQALGYRIHYQLTQFTKDYTGQIVYYEGSVLFEEMKGRPSEQRKWERNRLAAYNGSSMHFLRSIISNQVTENGFKVLRLIRKPNTARPSDSLIRAKLRKFGLVTASHPEYRDSVNFWAEKSRLPKVNQYLITQTLNIADYTKPTGNADLFALAFADFPYIIYTKKRAPDDNAAYHPLSEADYPSTIITITKTNAVFDRNGIFTDPSSTIMEGAWGLSAVADLLPVDYEPPVKKK
jgi:hypothetical protein